MHELKSFVVPSDNDEFKTNADYKSLRSVVGEQPTCCVYRPESNSKIELVWIFSAISLVL